MAELTNLESKLGEVLGLAMAAQTATQKVQKLDGLAPELEERLVQMHDEAKETEQRATEVAGTFDGKKTAILDEARDVKNKATEMMSTYLESASDALDGFEFLTMAEAGEVGHWSIVDVLSQRHANAWATWKENTPFQPEPALTVVVHGGLPVMRSRSSITCARLM